MGAVPHPKEAALATTPLRVAVLVSGTGTNLQALLDACAADAFGAQVVVVGADRPGTQGIARAEQAAVPTFVLEVSQFGSRAEWDDELARAVAAHSPDLVVLAGFMKLVGGSFMAQFPDRIINTHPALSPSFAGMHSVRDALAYGVKVTGCTIFVVDEGIDTGPIVAQAGVPDSTVTMRLPCTNASRWSSGSCWSTLSARWPARVGPSPDERSASREHRGFHR